MNKKIILCLVLLLLSIGLYSEGKLINIEGVDIVIFDDYTWKYLDDITGDISFVRVYSIKETQNLDIEEVEDVDNIKDKVLIKRIKSKDSWDFFFIPTDKKENIFTKLLFETLNNEITITSIDIKYTDGTNKKIKEKFTVYPDRPAKILNINKIGGTNEIKRIDLDIDTVREVSNTSRMKIYGIK